MQFHLRSHPRPAFRGLSLVVFGSLATATSTPAQSQTTPTRTGLAPATLVVPGKSLGLLTLGMNRAQVHRVSGNPTRRVQIASTLWSEQWGGGYDRASQLKTTPDLEVTYQAGRVVQIETTQSRFRTRSGLRPGAALSAIVRRVHPLVHSLRSAPENPTENLLKHEFDGVQLGMAFEMTGPHDGTLYREDVADSLIVHRPGVPMISDKGSEWIESSPTVVFQSEEGNP